MARAALGWSLSDLSEASGIGRATIARFENGSEVREEKVAQLRAAFEAKRVRFIDSGKFAGAVYGVLHPSDMRADHD